MLAAARRGLYVVGYEINPLLVVYSKIITFRYRSKIKIIWGNYWHEKWPETDGIYVFLLKRYMNRLNNKITQIYDKPLRLVSFAFKIPNMPIEKEKNGIFLYKFN